MADSHKRESSTQWRAAGLAMALPAMMAACPLAGLLLGKMVDWLLKTSPYGTVIGLILGLLAGVRETILIIHKLTPSDTEKK